MSETIFTIKEDKKTLVVERTFQAPRSTVWKAWTNPDIFEKWWGPQGWTTKVKRMDFTENGDMVYVMTCNDPAQTDWYGKTSSGRAVYSDIDPENSFNYTDEFCDEEGNVTPGMPVMKIRMEFIEENGVTKVVSTGEYATPEELAQVMAMGMEAGLRQTWDRLEDLVTSSK